MAVVEMAIAIALGLLLAFLIFSAVMVVISEIIYLSWLWRKKRRARYDG